MGTTNEASKSSLEPDQIRDNAVILRCLYKLNMKAKKGVTFEQIRQAYYLKTSGVLQAHSLDFWENLEVHVPGVYRLPSQTFVAGVRRLLCQFIGRLNYEMGVHYVGDTRNKMVVEKKRIHQILEEINHKNISIEDFTRINNKYNQLFSLFFDILLEAKESIQQEVFHEKCLVTEASLYHDLRIVELIIDGTERTLVINNLLDIVHSANLAFIGHYISEKTGNLVYFYIDLEVISMGEEELIRKIRFSPAFTNNTKKYQSVIMEIKNHGRKQKFNTLLKKFKNIARQLKDLKQLMLEEGKPINRSYDNLLSDLKELEMLYTSAYSEYKKEEVIFEPEALDRLREAIHLNEDILLFFKSNMYRTPFVFKRYLEAHVTMSSFLNIGESHEIMQIALKLSKQQQILSVRRRLIYDMWQMFFKYLGQHFSRYNIKIYYKHQKVNSPIVVSYEEVMISQDDKTKKTYISDQHKSIEVVDPASYYHVGTRKIPKRWAKYSEYIPIMIKGHEMYYRITTIFANM